MYAIISLIRKLCNYIKFNFVFSLLFTIYLVFIIDVNFLSVYFVLYFIPKCKICKEKNVFPIELLSIFSQRGAVVVLCRSNRWTTLSVFLSTSNDEGGFKLAGNFFYVSLKEAWTDLENRIYMTSGPIFIISKSI